jgi:hypothetical protein
LRALQLHTQECLAWIFIIQKMGAKRPYSRRWRYPPYDVCDGGYLSQSVFACFIFNESTFRSTRPSWRPCEEDVIKSLEMSPYEWVLIVDSTKVLPPSPPFFPSLPLAQSIPFSQKRRRRKDDGHIHTLASCYSCFGCPLQAQDGHITWAQGPKVCVESR